MLNKFKKNKKGQLSDTMTWVVATIIIIVILLVFIYASSFLGNFNSVELGAKGFFIDDIQEDQGNLFDTKTEIAYKINSKNKLKINNWVGANEE